MELSVPVLVILAIVLIGLFIWLLVREKDVDEVPVRTSTPVAVFNTPSEPVKTVPDTAPAVVATPDDLEVIEGIGPKIGQVLRQAGVTTFAQLAGMEPGQISAILQSAGMRLADPKSWPEQARLAANGDMEGLRVYQTKLSAGR